MKTRRTDLTGWRRGVKTTAAIGLATLLMGSVGAAAHAQDLRLQEAGKWPPHGAGAPQAISVQDGIAYCAVGEDGLAVVDVHDLANPQPLGGYLTGGSVRDVVLSGRYAYLALGEAGLEIVETSDPTNLRTVGSADTEGEASGLAVSGHYAYVADLEAGVQVIDIHDLTNPRQVGGLDLSAAAIGIVVSGQYAYVAVGDPGYVGRVDLGGLLVLDVSDPLKLRQLGTYDIGRTATGVTASGTHAYVAFPHLGIQVIDVADPGNSEFIASIDG